MRIRRKKHLKERLEKVKDYLIVADRDMANVKQAIQDKRYFDYGNWSVHVGLWRGSREICYAG